MVSNLFFRPSEGVFDVARIREYLDAQPDIIEDPHGTELYLVCGDPEAVQNRWQKRNEDRSIEVSSLCSDRTDPEPDIVTCLEAGHLLVSSSDVANDWFADDPNVEIGPPHVLTDGTYAWPADLAYYVRNYHVRLPTHVVMHARRNHCRVPPDVNVASLKLE